MRIFLRCSTIIELGQVTTLKDILQYLDPFFQQESDKNCLTLAIEYLAVFGNICYFKAEPAIKDIIVLDSMWFGINIVRRILLSLENETLEMERSTTDKRSIKEATVRAFLLKYQIVAPAHVYPVIEMLKHLQVCLGVTKKCLGTDGEEKYLVFPHADAGKAPRVVPVVIAYPTQQAPLMLSKRLQCDDACYIIPSGMFSMLQQKIRQRFDAFGYDACDMSYHEMGLKTKSGIQAHIFLSASDISEPQSIDFMVWTVKPEERHLGEWV